MVPTLDRTAGLRAQPQTASAQPSSSKQHASIAEPHPEPATAAEQVKTFYKECNAAQQTELRSLFSGILSAQQLQPSGSFQGEDSHDAVATVLHKPESGRTANERPPMSS